MVQVLPKVSSFGEEFGRAIGQGASAGLESGIARKQAMAQLAKENQEIYKATGIKLSSLDPEMRKKEFQTQLEGIQKEKERQSLPEKYKAQYGAKYEALTDAMKNMGLTLGEGEDQVESGDQNVDQEKQNLLGITPSEKFEEGSEKKLFKEKGQPPHTSKAIAKMSLVNPTVANNWQRQNEDFFRRQQHEEDVKLKKSKALEEKSRDFHKESEKYDSELLSTYKKAVNQTESIKNIEGAIKSGKVKPGSVANIFRGMGTLGDKIANAILNKDEATLMSSIPYLIEGWKDIFGVRLSDADLRVIQDKLPDIGKSPEANLAVLKIMKKYSNMTKLRYNIGKEIKAKNNKLRPLGYADEVESRFEEMMAPVKVVNPNTGNIIEIPAHEVSSAVKSGARLANE